MTEKDERGRVHGLAIAAALTVLGGSVGVNVQELMAADQLQSDQVKIAPSVQSKDITQQKIARRSRSYHRYSKKLRVCRG